MRTTSTLFIVFAVLVGVQLFVLTSQLLLLTRINVAPLPSSAPPMTNAQVVELERRAAQVDVRLKEIQASLKDRPIVREADDGFPANNTSAPIEYKKWIAVIVAPKATAAVEFTDEIEKGVNYRYRCLNQGQEVAQVGEGKVFENYRTVPGEEPGSRMLINDGGQLFIQAGAIKVEWSYEEQGKGYIYYDPLAGRVYLARPSDYATLDLSRFGR